jgi:hypothetical protein
MQTKITDADLEGLEQILSSQNQEVVEVTG